MEIKFKDLSGWLKTAVVLMWIIGGLNTLTFLVAFIAELI